MAADSDCLNPYLPQYQGDHPGYHPYFAVGDVNGDGRDDLIVGLAKGGVLRLYGMVGRPTGYARAFALDPLDWLAQAGVLIQDHGISVQVLYSDESVSFHWDPRAHRLRRDRAGP
jgi:hypothetical protein